MHKNLGVALILCLAFSMASCRSKLTPFPSAVPTEFIPTVIPSQTAYYLRATETPPPKTRSQETNTPTLTATAQIFDTSILPIQSFTVLSTLDAVVAKHPDLQDWYHETQNCFFYPSSCAAPGVGLSPDASWAIFYLRSTLPEKAGGGLKFIAMNSSDQWEVYFSELYFEGTADYSDAGFVRIAHWSVDYAAVYVVPEPETDGGDGWLWRTGEKLFRLDLKTGEWENTQMGNAYSFSPSGLVLAYRADDGIHLHQLRTGKEQIIPVAQSFKKYGQLTWSPDEKQLVFVAAEWGNTYTDPTDPDEERKGLILITVDLASSNSTILLESDDPPLYPVSWPVSNIIALADYHSGPATAISPRYYINLWTHEINPTAGP